MALLRKDTDYAVRALIECALASKDEFLTSSKISKKQGIPLNYLRRILSVLTQAGLLKAREGASGGVNLAKPAKKITLADIAELFQGGIEISECMFRKKLCPNRQTCVLRERIKKIERKIQKDFDGLTIEKLTKKIRGG